MVFDSISIDRDREEGARIRCCCCVGLWGTSTKMGSGGDVHARPLLGFREKELESIRWFVGGRTLEIKIPGSVYGKQEL
jgi:hypothetical protein